jgi:hypothetical protein
MVAIERTKKRRRLVNPQTGKKRVSAGTRAARSRPKKANPLGELITVGALANPQRGPMSTKKTKKRKINKHKPARKNPAVIVRYKARPNGKKKSNPHKRRRRPNPNIFGAGKKLIESGAYALAGLVAARQIPQMLLQTNNAGWKGYLANAATAIAASYAAGKFVGPEAAGDVLVGGGLYLVNRVVTEQFSPIGKAFRLSGTGDAAASSSMGRIRVGYFPLPVQRDRNGNEIIPQAVIDAVKANMPQPAIAAAASRVSGVSRRMAPRF